ncbi:MJ0042-type zinc finger domain-containing protein [Novosphingobium ovatum]|uniref:MJ0042-type zinc finger domain-containing protein n=1 Tax=Novosphingobium ovatum TaxID=1908523 RepID=UPI0029FF3545|nr:MJ0042-type zinc finger domain-containing protein [Novosphingobium ovatum]
MLYNGHMIISCPACGTRYAVPDSAIGVEGRTVRCAKCKHSWFQDGPEIFPPAAARAEPAPPAPVTPEAQPVAEASAPVAAAPVVAPQAAEEAPAAPVAEPAPPPVEVSPPAPEMVAPPEGPAPQRTAYKSYLYGTPEKEDWTQTVEAPDDAPVMPRLSAVDETANGREAEVQAQADALWQQAVTAINAQPQADEAAPRAALAAMEETHPSDVIQPYADYAEEEADAPRRPRRNPARLWTILAILFAAAALSAMALVAHFGLPSGLPFGPIGGTLAEPNLKLEFPANGRERQQMPGSNDYFSIRGTITNIGTDRQSVPALLIVLRDAQNRIVYTQEATPPKAVLAPGESETVNTAIFGAPRSAAAAEVHWKPR